MSKSLKNFTTIREALAMPEWNARSLRICFLTANGWADGIQIGEDLVRTTASWEDKVNNFFIKAVEAARSTAAGGVYSNSEASADDQAVLAALETAKKDLDALTDEGVRLLDFVAADADTRDVHLET